MRASEHLHISCRERMHERAFSRRGWCKAWACCLTTDSCPQNLLGRQLRRAFGIFFCAVRANLAGLAPKSTMTSNTGWVRGLAVGAALCWCIAQGANRASFSEPFDELIAALIAADGDKSSIKTTQAPDGPNKVVVCGDFYDGRRFLRAILAGLRERGPNSSGFDIDFDIKLATVTGFNGQALHDVTLRVLSKDGEMLEFGLTSKLGLGDLSGDLRGREARRMIHLEVNDAGAFFRFTDVYQHVEKGRLQMEMEIPRTDHASQRGTLTMYDFALVGEQTFNGILNSQPLVKSTSDRIAVSRVRFDFQLFQDRVVVSNGFLRSAAFAATISGNLDIGHNDLNLWGTLLPVYASDQRLFRPTPHSTQEGSVSLTYEVIGSLQAPAVRINPFGDPAPGLLRKLFTPDWDDK